MVVCRPKEKFTQKKPAAFDQEMCRKKMTIWFYPHKPQKVNKAFCLELPVNLPHKTGIMSGKKRINREKKNEDSRHGKCFGSFLLRKNGLKRGIKVLKKRSRETGKKKKCRF